ncbi:ATP-binding cassette transporter snq2 [Coniosporium apollinis]|uniref:ATP-binding cassette transporter snq2 n=2 Tax=Coniosporium TaxID=2810619 RepID=A0ABQ9P5K2_9PEZI|nr:ATP-binding cassette transporter snq2 [Cladosporium sp. JES 115]KAJ9669857.1 ATP-binding cassette transporter snq2 [Coniosporium apollinis]
MGGYVQTGLDGICELCAYKNGDEFSRGFNVYYLHIWRDFGITIGFVLFNFAIVYLSTWLRLNGKNPLKGMIGGLTQKKKVLGKKDIEKRKEKREVQV